MRKTYLYALIYKDMKYLSKSKQLFFIIILGVISTLFLILTTYLTGTKILTPISRALALQYAMKLSKIMNVPIQYIVKLDEKLLMVLSAIIVQLPLVTSAPIAYYTAYTCIVQLWQMEKILGTGEYLLVTPLTKRDLMISKIIVSF